MGDAPAPTGMQRARGVWSSVWSTLKKIDLNPETAFRPKRPPPASRLVTVNLPLPSEAYDNKGRLRKKWTYVTNQVKSSKYTIYNFVFKNLLEQFRRVANIFFLGTWTAHISAGHPAVFSRVHDHQSWCGHAPAVDCIGHHHD